MKEVEGGEMSLQGVITRPPEQRNRETGIAAVGAVPWGMHLCHFYETKKDLIDILVPYFKTGLENNESCIWVTSEPLSEKEAEEALREDVPDFAQYLERGQIEITPYDRWYLKGRDFNQKRVLNSWVDKLNQALDRGYDGLRVTGNTSWLERKDWGDFIDYEEEVNNAIGKYHMLAICTYPLGRCGPSEIMDVVSNHQFTLTKQAGDWVLVGSSEHKWAVDTLQESEKKYRALFENMLNGFAYCQILVDENNKPIDYVHLEVNDAWERLIGLKREDVIGKKITEVIPGIKESKTDLISIYGEVALTGRETSFDLFFEPLNKWFNVSVYSPEKGYFIAVFENITELKRAGGCPEEASDEDRLKEQNHLTPLQEKFIKSNPEGLEGEEGIRLVFSLCRYRPECDDGIERYVKHFKSLRALLSASGQELQRIGVCPRGIFAIKLLYELPMEVLKEKILDQPVYKSPQEVLDYLSYSMRDLKKEVFKVIYLNNRNQIIDVVDLFEGTLDSIPIRPREIVDSAIKHNASALIFVHNHPTGDPTPSKTDKQLTRDLAFVGMILQIKVLDHIIIGENRYFSFADDGLIQKYEDDFLTMKIRRMPDTGVHSLKNLLPVFLFLVPKCVLIEEAGAVFF